MCVTLQVCHQNKLYWSVTPFGDNPTKLYGDQRTGDGNLHLQSIMPRSWICGEIFFGFLQLFFFLRNSNQIRIHQPHFKASGGDVNPSAFFLSCPSNSLIRASSLVRRRGGRDCRFATLANVLFSRKLSPQVNVSELISSHIFYQSCRTHIQRVILLSWNLKCNH